jgi:hypothetical protein
MQVKIRVHAHLRPRETVQEGLRHSLTGPLYLEIGDEFFPWEGAGTIVVLVLGSWIDNAMRLVLPDSEVRNKSMDWGDEFHMWRAAGSDDVAVRLYDSYGRPRGDHVVSYRRYLAALRGAAKHLLNEINANALQGHEEGNALREHVLHLQRLEQHIDSRGLP